MKTKPILLWAALILAATVALRMPLFNRPLGNLHEWVTAHSLITLQAWADHGMATYHYGPVINYGQPGDVGIPWYGYSLLEDARGNIYHASYPPLAYYVPYAVFKLLGIHPDVAPLEWFNLSLSLISGGLVFFTIYLMYRRQGSPWAAQLGLWAGAAYLFAPTVLWFQTNTYFVDMFLQPLFILHIFLTSELLGREKPGRGLVAAWVGVYFLMAYTEWLAGPYLLVLLVLLWRRREGRRWQGPFLGLCVAGVAAIVLVVVHYTSLAGFHRTMELFAGKFREKSGYTEESKIKVKDLVYMGKELVKSFSGLWVLLAVYLAALVAAGRGRWREGFRRPEAVLVTLAFWPLVLHFFALMSFWAGHNYNLLKLAPLVAFLTAILMERVLTVFAGDAGRRRLCLGAAAGCLALCVATYFKEHKPWRHDAALADLGRAVGQMSTPDEFICMQKPLRIIDPQIMFYAQRSILYYTDDAALREHARRYQVAKCLFLQVDDKDRIIAVRHLTFPTGGQ